MITNKVLVDGKRAMGEFYHFNEQSIDKKQFKVGSLDQLMQMMDEFSKQDVMLEASLKRNEGVYLATAEELSQEAKLQIEKQ